MADGLRLPPVLASDERFRLLGELAGRVSDIDRLPVLVYLVDQVNASALPQLAEQFSLVGDGWELAESDEARRALIKSAIELHRFKGTPWAVREVFRRLGFGEVELIEHIGQLSYDGRRSYNGWMVHGDEASWAVYRVVLQERAITNDQATRLRALLDAVAPARCHLASLEYLAVPIRYNGEAQYNGQYNQGSS